MKILLCGDYSSVHSELTSALKKMGHDVTLLSDGDSYKNLPADIKLPFKEEKKSYAGVLIQIILDILGLSGIFRYFSTMKDIELEQYDIVQVINPVVIPQFGAIGNLLFLRHLKARANKIFLCALGDDSFWVKACLQKKFKYSALDRLSFATLPKYYYSLKYIISPAYYLLNYYAVKISSKVIAGLSDYKIAYKTVEKKVEFIRLPISRERFTAPTSTITNPNEIVIFHAWQNGKELRKGNDLLDAAVKEVVEIYGKKKVKYIIASGMTYNEFINSYNQCDIYLDQVYSYDRGVAGALGMCAGKVVFSGFELEERYSETLMETIKKVGINATPSIPDLVKSLSLLIENPNLIDDIKHNAYHYAVDSYAAEKIATEYLKTWADNHD